MFCGECGTENPETNRFCKSCGKPLKRAGSGVNPAPAVSGPAPVIPPIQPPVMPAPAKKRKLNWIGIVSLICGILSWGILTILLALIAIILGVISLYTLKKGQGRISVSGIFGILIALGAIMVSVALH